MEGAAGAADRGGEELPTDTTDLSASRGGPHKGYVGCGPRMVDITGSEPRGRGWCLYSKGSRSSDGAWYGYRRIALYEGLAGSYPNIVMACLF